MKVRDARSVKNNGWKRIGGCPRCRGDAFTEAGRLEKYGRCEMCGVSLEWDYEFGAWFEPIHVSVARHSTANNRQEGGPKLPVAGLKNGRA